MIFGNSDFLDRLYLETFAHIHNLKMSAQTVATYIHYTLHTSGKSGIMSGNMIYFVVKQDAVFIGSDCIDSYFFDALSVH